ncbi:MAG TPA: hypothetical protein VFS90_05620 [Pyrinomonadaceae bacterium]|nr:hypothetical protein [Pyrinomonadaceae bacterium]
MSSNARVKLASWVPFCCCLTVLCLAIASCKAPAPTSDSTPPALVWNVFNYGTNAQADHNGNPTINVKRGERYRITLKANDPEGVKQIKLNPTLGSGELSWTCKAPPGGENIAQNKTATLGPLVQDLSVDANGNVLTSIFLLQDVDFTMECQSGWSFTNGAGKLTGQASNFFNGTTTATISFSVSP